MKQNFKWAIVASASALALAHPASAQQAEQPDQSAQNNEIGDIVVTAQKRSESVQRTALAVTAVSGEDLRSRQITSVASIAQQVPNLNISEQIGQARITMRGIGVENISTASEGSVAFNTDGVFYSRSAAALASFYDLERIEVLRGPQGTLYGRNATGGSVNLITKKPDFGTANGYVTLTGGNYGTLNTEAAMGAGLSDTVAFRIAGQTQRHTGYGHNLSSGTPIDDRDSQSIRGQLLFQPSEKLKIVLGADYFQSDDHSNSYHYFGPGLQDAAGAVIQPVGILIGGSAAPNVRDINATVDPHATSKSYGFRADISYELTDAVTLRSISSYRRSEYALDTDASPVGDVPLFPVFLGEKSNQYSQEFQLNVDTSSNKFVAGLYYLNEKIDGFISGPFNLDPGGTNFLAQGYYAGGTLKTSAFAAFAQDTYSISEAFRVTLGARYSVERKTVHDQADFDLVRAYDPSNVSLVPFFDSKKTFRSFTPKIGVEYDVNARTLFYASFSKGFKAGTYNLGSSLPALRPEKVDAYTAGLKTTFADRRVRANIEGFYYKYSDLQVGKVKNLAIVVENAATATIYGLEGEFTFRPFEAPLTLTTNASWLHARFDSYVSSDAARPGGDGNTFVDANGNYLPNATAATPGAVPAYNLKGFQLSQAPNYVINLGAEYVIEAPFGDITLRGESTWSDRVYLNSFNRKEVSQAPYSLQNASIVFSSNDKKWQLTAFIRNIANKTIKASGQVATPFVGAPIIGFLQPPRTFGGALTFNF